MKNRHAETVNPWKFDRVGGRVTLIFFTILSVRIRVHSVPSLSEITGFYAYDFKTRFVLILFLYLSKSI